MLACGLLPANDRHEDTSIKCLKSQKEIIFKAEAAEETSSIMWPLFQTDTYNWDEI
jgi:hypothetical protein